MTGFTKLWSEILSSSIWGEDDKTRIVWITMLAAMGPDYMVRASVGGLAHLARVSREDCEKSIAILSSPDADSRSREHEGRRIQVVDGGFLILNGGKYREARSHDERKVYMREYMKKYRKPVNSDVNNRKQDVNFVNRGKPQLAQAEAEAEAESLSVQPPSQNNNTLDEKQIVSPTAPPCETKKRWEKPTLEQVTLQAAKIGLPKAEADKFFNYYESNGWRVGKNPMKSWQHALTNWSVNFRQRSFVASPYFKPDAKPDKPLPTIADLKAQRQQQSQIL